MVDFHLIGQNTRAFAGKLFPAHLLSEQNWGPANKGKGTKQYLATTTPKLLFLDSQIIILDTLHYSEKSVPVTTQNHRTIPSLGTGCVPSHKNGSI